MGKRRLSMRKIREVLKLKLGGGLSDRQVAGALGISPATVGDLVRRASAAGITWPLAEDTGDDALEELLYPRQEKDLSRPLPDMAYLHRELAKKGVTLALLWEEYAAEHPQDHYSYPQLARRYRAWRDGLEVSMRQVHKAGERMYSDFAGEKLRIVDAKTGEISYASLFVACMGFSSYTYAEAFPSEQLPCWIAGHVNAISFFGAAPHIITPDNPKAIVTRACRYEPELNRTFSEMAAHYGCVVIPARVRKPKDKAKVESAVLQVERWVIAPLRGRTFFSLDEANQAVRERLAWLNNRRMRGMEASRSELFAGVDSPAMLPLPTRPYEYATFKRARVNIDYHVEVEGHYYSVPYRLVGEEVEVRMTRQAVEIVHRGKRVASHPRSYVRGAATTCCAHRPASHRAYLEWTPSRIVAWAAETGEATAELVERIMAEKPHPEMGYRACLGIIRLGKRYGAERMEQAAARALAAGAVSYKSIKSMLASGLDGAGEQGDGERPPLPSHSNLRGPDYYN
jgi:transposase